jgi:putative Mg2+ transporter-C (MgtC) family protein
MHPFSFLYGEPQGQSWIQFGELALALVLSTFIGLEREFRAKSAGLRTHTLVGVAAAPIMLVSKYGFGNVIVRYAIVLAPSRVAVQIVSGIGFRDGRRRSISMETLLPIAVCGCSARRTRAGTP